MGMFLIVPFFRIILLACFVFGISENVFGSEDICSSLLAKREAIRSHFPKVLKSCGESFNSALECCLNPDSCVSGGVLSGFGSQTIQDAAQSMSANGAMLASTAQAAANKCSELRSACFQQCQQGQKGLNISTQYELYQGHTSAMRYCSQDFLAGQNCLMAVVAQASQVVSQSTSVAQQTAAMTAMQGAGALSGSGTSGGEAFGEGSDAVAATPSELYNGGKGPAAPCVTPTGRPCGSSAVAATPSELYNGGKGPAAPCVTPTGRPCGSSAVAAAAPSGEGSPFGGSGESGSLPSGGRGVALAATSTESADPSSHIDTDRTFASRTSASFGSTAAGSSHVGASTSSRSFGDSSFSVSNLDAKWGPPENDCDLEEKVFTPACFDTMNDYCTKTQRQGIGCESFCGRNASATACDR